MDAGTAVEQSIVYRMQTTCKCCTIDTSSAQCEEHAVLILVRIIMLQELWSWSMRRIAPFVR